MALANRRYWQQYQRLKFMDEEHEEQEMMVLGHFGKKASKYIRESDAFINIAVGSIRSGKTIATIVAFLEYMKHSAYTEFAMAGKTLKALTRNVVRPMKAIMQFLGIHYTHHKYDGELKIYGLGRRTKTITLYGIEKKGSEDTIKGSTYAGTFLDEVTVMDEDGVRMLISRNSDGDSKIFMTCNPGNPNNFIYQEYVDNQVLLDDGTVKVTNFLLEDNKSLTQEYIRHIKSIYPKDSIFYKRNILGLWVSGQGLIYSKFNDNNIYLDTEQKPLSYYDYLEIGSDYGSSSTTCFNLIGIKEFTDHTEYDVIAEAGYNAEKEGISMTDAEIVDLLIEELQEPYQLGEDNIIYPSHDAKSFKTQLEKTHNLRMQIQTFTPNTLECISVISNLFDKDYLRINENCKNTIECIRGYEWDKNAAKRGEDKPKKVDDHYVDSLRAPIMNHVWDDTGVGFLFTLKEEHVNNGVVSRNIF